MTTIEQNTPNYLVVTYTSAWDAKLTNDELTKYFRWMLHLEAQAE